MGCLLPLAALALPRFLLVVLWVFTNYLDRAFDSFIWPALGFFLLPTTTIAYAIAQNSLDSDFGKIVVVALGVMLDIGILGSGRGPFKRWSRSR